jgi:glutathione synthase/RimK-type ligase-like ATP-grasp enzyme
VQLAILVSPAALVSPSSFSSLEHFADVARERGVEASFVGEHSLDDLGRYDALFVRMTTGVGNAAHRFALKAAKLGLPVIDDPVSIVRGSNKVLQSELLTARGISTPQTVIIRSLEDIPSAIHKLGLPIVLKISDGCFCRGVERADTRDQCRDMARRLLAFGSPILAQEFIPTRFDWRIGVLGGDVLFACRYHMVDGHWQVVARGSRGSLINGPVEPVPFQNVPGAVIEIAQRAAQCVGSGLYGVDIKETADGPVVIEVNDNPDMDVDAETPANPEAWELLADWFAWAVASRREIAPRLRLA